jgi:V8-like Glu-specific endopeptidase
MLVSRFPLRIAAFSTILFILAIPGFSQDTKTGPKDDKKPEKKEIPTSFAEAPTDVAKLKALEARVEAMLDKAKAATVGVRMGAAQGSGVIVTEDGYVLTAGHVSAKPGLDCVLVMPNGETLKGKTLGRNGSIDSGMIKIVKEGKYPYAEMGRSSKLKKGQWVVAIGHPGGFRPNRTPVVRVGRVLYADPTLIRTDATLVGGDSGGPLFDLDGKVIGIHSRIGGASITENIHVPIDTFRLTWDRLAASQNWGGQIGQQIIVKSAGGRLIFEKKDKLTANDPLDRILESHYKTYPLHVHAGAAYTIDLSSKEFDSYLRLEDAKHKVLAEDDDGAAKNSQDARIVYKASRDETLTIVAISFAQGETGAFRLTVHEAESRDAFVSGEVDVFRAIKLPRQVVSMVVDKYAKSGVPLHVTAVLLSADGKPLAGKEAVVSWIDGKEPGKETLQSNDDGILRWKILKNRAKSLSLKLPEGARALLRVTDATGNPIGPFFSPENDPSKVKVQSAGGPIVFEVIDKLTSADKSDPTKKGAFVKTHELRMLAGETYTLDLESDDFDPYLRLEDAAGTLLKEDDDSASFLNARIVFRPKTDGVYRLAVTSSEPDDLGAYRLTVRQVKRTVAEKK